MSLKKWLNEKRELAALNASESSVSAETSATETEAGTRLLLLVADGKGHFLVSVREATGAAASKHLVLGPTVQELAGRLETVKNGKFPDRAELTEDKRVVWFNSLGSQTSPTSRIGILSHKNSVNSLKGRELETEFWVTKADLLEALRHDDLSPELLLCLAAADFIL